MKSRNIRIISSGQKMRMIVLEPEKGTGKMPGILWIHGGGYAMGMASMVYISRGKDLAESPLPWRNHRSRKSLWKADP